MPTRRGEERGGQWSSSRHLCSHSVQTKKRVSDSSAERICCMYQYARSLPHSGQCAVVCGSPLSSASLTSMTSDSTCDSVVHSSSPSSRPISLPQASSLHTQWSSPSPDIIIEPHSSQNFMAEPTADRI